MSTNFSGDVPDLSDWISQAEAARLHGVSRQAISKLVRSGRLKSLDIGGHILVSRAEVLLFRPQSAGRPRTGDEKEDQRVLALISSWSVETRLAVFQRLRKEFPIHPLEAKLNTEAEVILEAIDRAGPLTLRMIRGVIAEAAFEVHVVRNLNGWKNLPIDGNPPYDFLLDDDAGPVKVQVKLQRSKSGVVMAARQANKQFPDDMYVVETQRTRAGLDLKTKGSTRPYKFGEFDILAVSIYPSTADWKAFKYTVADLLLPNPLEPSQLFKFQPVPKQNNNQWFDTFEACVTAFRVLKSDQHK